MWSGKGDMCMTQAIAVLSWKAFWMVKQWEKNEIFHLSQVFDEKGTFERMRAPLKRW